MGSYTDLSIAGYPLVESKNAVIPEAMTIFRETDKRVFTRKLSERNELVWGKPTPTTDDETETAIQYACATGKVIDRLNVMGFTIRRSREEFESCRRLEVEKFTSWANGDLASDWLTESQLFFERLTFDGYASALEQIIAQSLRPSPFDNCDREGLDPLVKYILRDGGGFLLGFLGSDLRSLVRLACELVDARSEIVQDITELVSAGYYEEDEAVCEKESLALTSAYAENSSRIILTEGSTDTAILREALGLLYPHLSGYYSFLDFDASRSQGGAGHLVSIVKAFAAAGITNRIVALFDNDTAAHEARCALDTISLPDNIAVLYYPDVGTLLNYPTLGPAGLTSLDVNGLAASIELYLGDDVLAEGGVFTPVQWKGFSDRLGKYQGEVMHKARLHSVFQRKVERCKADREAMKRADWSGLVAILERIFTAFD
jgi:HEPN/Toprim N-terminal domain 1